MSLEPGKLNSILQQLSAANPVKTWWLAYSGGVDSQVLLHLLSGLSLDLKAVYIDHGLQPESPQWAEHCRGSCQRLGVPFQVIAVDAQPRHGEGPEAAARKARYAALAELIESEQHCLLTGQHQDDQAETFLLQLFRGAGAAGLAAMPLCNHFSSGWHMRPLLGFSRQEILDYALLHQLAWVDDPSNQSNHYDRNFLRNQVLPVIKQRWSALDKTLATAAEQQAENNRLLQQLAELDLQQVVDKHEGLAVEKILSLDEARLRNVLRHWIKQQGHAMPSRRVLQQILQQMLYARQDANPEVLWANVQMHRYRGRLYLNTAINHDATQQFNWDGQQPLKLESLRQMLMLRPTLSSGLRQDLLSSGCQVRFRQGGEKLQPAGRDGHHGLKQLFQEADVPPWMRDRIPLIYCENELVAVVGYWIAEGFTCADGDQGLTPELTDLEQGGR